MKKISDLELVALLAHHIATTASTMNDIIIGTSTIDRAFWDRGSTNDNFSGFAGASVTTADVQVPYNTFIRNS